MGDYCLQSQIGIYIGSQEPVTYTISEMILILVILIHLFTFRNIITQSIFLTEIMKNMDFFNHFINRDSSSKSRDFGLEFRNNNRKITRNNDKSASTIPDKDDVRNIVSTKVSRP